MKTNIMKKLSLFVAAFAFCAVLTAKPIDVDAALAAPTGLTQSNYTENGTAVQIKWDAVLGATGGYQYSISTNQNAEGTYVASSINYANIYNLKSGTTYYVKVRAYEGTTPGAWSAIAKVDTAPASLSSLKQVKAEAKKIKISWTAAAGATGYEVSYGLYSDGSNPSFVKNVGASTTSYTFSVPKDSAYYVFVYPYRNAANSNFYAYSTGKYFVGKTKPSTPKSLKIAVRSYVGGYVGNTYVPAKTTYFTWNPVSNINNTNGYEVQIFKSNGKTKLKTLKVSGYANNLAKWKSEKLFTQAFKYRVRAYVTVNGKKYYSSWSSKKTYIPAAPLKKAYTNGKLVWKKVTGADSYTVYYKYSSSAKWKVAKKNIKGTSYYAPMNKYGKTYYYIRANKVIGKKNSTTKDFDAYVVD